MTLAEAATSRLPTIPLLHRPARGTAGAVALLALAAVIAECAAGALPDGAVVGVVTPVRLVLGIGLLAVAVARPPIRLDRPRGVLLAAVALLIGASAFATMYAGSDYASWRGLVTTAAAGLLAAGVRRIVPDDEPATGLLALLAVAAAALAAVHQVADGVVTGFCRGAVDGSADVCGPSAAVRAVGTFANPNLLAAFLVLMLPLAAVGSAALASRSSRLVGTGVIVVGYAAVLLSGSRGGILAAVVGVAAFIVLRRPSLRRLVAAAVVATAGSAVLVALTHGDVGVRADVWRASAHLLLSHPLGVGPGRAGGLIDTAIPGAEAFQHAHDLWLNQAVELGWAGLGATLTITVCAGLLVTSGPDVGSRPVAAIGAGLAGFAVVSLLDHPANASRIALALAVVVGLAAGGVIPTPMSSRTTGGLLTDSIRTREETRCPPPTPPRSRRSPMSSSPSPTSTPRSTSTPASWA